jgi:hypothetical protein
MTISNPLPRLVCNSICKQFPPALRSYWLGVLTGQSGGDYDHALQLSTPPPPSPGKEDVSSRVVCGRICVLLKSWLWQSDIEALFGTGGFESGRDVSARGVRACVCVWRGRVGREKNERLEITMRIVNTDGAWQS